MPATLAERRAFLLALFQSPVFSTDKVHVKYIIEKVMFALAPMTSALSLRAALDHDNRERYDKLIQQAVS